MKIGVTVNSYNYFAYDPNFGNRPYFSGIHTAVGELVHFYNPDDPILLQALRIHWAKSLAVTGDNDYHHVVAPAGPGTFYRDINEQQQLTWPQNGYEIMAHLLQSRTEMLGRVPVPAPQGPPPLFDRQLNLQADFPLDQRMGRQITDHSGQFRSYNMRRHLYWTRLLENFGLA